MGAWGTGIFENDDAMEFLSEALGEDGPDSILEHIEAVTDLGDDDYLEAPEASMALAAAELVATSAGTPSSRLPDEVADGLPWEWEPSSDDVANAVRAIHRVAEESELSELWQESEDSFEEWRGVLDNLLKRLGDDGL